MGPRGAHRAAIPILVAVLCGSMVAADKLSELQARFDSETNAVHKAKMLERLGDAEFDEAGRAEQAGDYIKMGLLLEKYRDNVRVASEALLKANPDAERHPNGYKQLEMHLQKGLREMDEFLLEAPDPYKPPLQLVRQDLLKMDDALLRHLFPEHPAPKLKASNSLAAGLSNFGVRR
ncbi:MAG TPA: hypothetical protein VMI32_13540 [Candidatus Solibacter sp.]|nr:hypothetical protein [Candidatus Solibacter sp.]